jgi:effector-binding domain-containing protein
MTDIVTVELPAQNVASIKKNSIDRDELGAFLSSSAIALLVYIKEQGLQVNGRGFLIYHNDSEEEELNVEICLPVSQNGKDRGEIQFKNITGGNAVSSVLKGMKFLNVIITIERIFFGTTSKA